MKIPALQLKFNCLVYVYMCYVFLSFSARYKFKSIFEPKTIANFGLHCINFKRIFLQCGFGLKSLKGGWENCNFVICCPSKFFSQSFQLMQHDLRNQRNSSQILDPL